MLSFDIHGVYVWSEVVCGINLEIRDTRFHLLEESALEVMILQYLILATIHILIGLPVSHPIHFPTVPFYCSCTLL